MQTAFPNRSLRWSAKEANFLGKIFYGSKTLSAFELGRGYTPRVTDCGELTLIEPEVIQANLDDRATKHLNDILKHPKQQNCVP